MERFFDKDIILKGICSAFYILLVWIGWGTKTQARTYASVSNVRTYYNNANLLSTDVLLTLADSLVFKCDKPDSAIICYTVLTNRYKDTKEDKELAYLSESWHNMWYAYFFHYYDYVKAKECLLKFQGICEKRKKFKSTVYMMYGAMYEVMANQTNDDSLKNDAARYYRLAISEAVKDQNKKVAVNGFTNLVSIYSGKKELLHLNKEFEMMKKVMRSEQSSFIYQFAFYNYQYSLMAAKGQYAKALAINERLIKIIPHTQDYLRNLLFAYNDRSHLFKKSKLFDKAVENSLLVAKICEERNVKDGMLLAYSDLSDYYAAVGNKEKSNEYKYKYLGLKDSIFNYRQLATVKEMSFLAEMKEVNEQIAQMENARRKWIFMLVIVSCVAIVTVVILLIIRNKNKKLRQSNEILYEKNQEMLRQDEERKHKYRKSTLDEDAKEQMMNQVRDAVGNTLEVFSSEFNIDRLAELANLKSKQVSQVINEVYGSNFNAFVNEYRIKEACRKMDDASTIGTLTIEAVGNMVGFKSRNSFINAFKKFTGLTPSEYLSISKEKIANS